MHSSLQAAPLTGWIAECLPSLHHKFAKLGVKSIGAESLSVLPNAVAIESISDKLKLIDGFDDRLAGLFVEKQPGLAVNHGFGSSALAERNNRRSAGLRFDRRDSEVLFRRKNEGSSVHKMITQDIVGLIAENLDVGRCIRKAFTQQRPVANDNQLTRRHLPERADNA